MSVSRKKQNTLVKTSLSRKIFLVCNTVFLVFVGLVCILPFINLLAISFSSKSAVTSGQVTFVPVEFTTAAYDFIVTSGSQFFKSLGVSLMRVGIAVPLSLFLMVTVAYPLSKESHQFRWRNVYAWFFVITILFSGGLIPSYMVVRYTGLLGSIYSLVLPGALNVFNMLIVMNYMRGLPKELEEAALIDGAGYLQCLFKVILPLSKPTLATVTLFTFVNHWNSWFDGMIYMNSVTDYPLQSYLQTVVIDPETFFRNNSDMHSSLATLMGLVNARTTNAAQMFLAMIPIMLIYPFLQKYFTTGLVMGSVKG